MWKLQDLVELQRFIEFSRIMEFNRNNCSKDMPLFRMKSASGQKELCKGIGPSWIFPIWCCMNSEVWVNAMSVCVGNENTPALRERLGGGVAGVLPTTSHWRKLWSLQPQSVTHLQSWAQLKFQGLHICRCIAPGLLLEHLQWSVYGLCVLLLFYVCLGV